MAYEERLIGLEDRVGMRLLASSRLPLLSAIPKGEIHHV